MSYEDALLHSPGRRIAVGQRSAVACLLAASLLCLLTAGCSRAFWRKHADRNVACMAQERMFDPRWQVPRLDPYGNPWSRYYEPYRPDCAPLPPDDPAAHRYMQHVGWMRGSESWHELGRSLSIENPHWLAPFGLVPKEAPLLEDEPAAAGPYAAPSGTPPVDVPPPAPPAEDEGPILPTAYAEPAIDDVPPAPTEADDDAPGDIAETSDADAPVPPKELVPGIENLTLVQALELAYIHNREYQFQIEDVYLAALDVAFERFQFNVRFLGLSGREPGADLTYSSVPGGENNLELASRFGVSQLLPTGAQFAAELTNNTLWLFAGPNQTSSASLLSYSLVQPLLRGAGRKLVLENLTQAERNLLYAVRNLARFRKLLFVNTVGGGGGGIGGVNLRGQSGGFLGLIQQQQAIDNQVDNIRRLEEQIEIQSQLAQQFPRELAEILPAFPEGVEIPPELAEVVRYDAADGLLFVDTDATLEQLAQLQSLSDDPAFQAAVTEIVQRLQIEVRTLQILQLQSQLISRRQQLRSLQQNYRDALDAYKIELGLPTNFQLSIDEKLREPFILIGDELIAQEAALRQYVQREDWLATNDDDPAVDRLRRNADLLAELLQEARTEGVALVTTDFERVREVLPARLERLRTDEDRERIREAFARAERIFAGLKADLTELDAGLRRLREQLGNDDLELQERKDAFSALAAFREDTLRYVRGLQGLQIALRIELIQLNPFDLGLDESVQLALDNRLDLMNVRATVVDARRKVEVAANQLQAVFNVVAEGDIRNRPGSTKPLDFRGENSEFRVGLQFTAPLDQIDERNAYRAALIDYQRARREYIAFEDQVRFDIRTAWRQLEVLERNFELSKESVRIAALQYDSAVEQSTAPAGIGGFGGGGGGGGGGRGDQQGLALLNALNTLLNAQNNLIGTWIDYERARLNIYRDMGIMVVDSRGVWQDEFYLRLADPDSPATTTPPQLLPLESALQDPSIGPLHDGRSEPLDLSDEFRARLALDEPDGLPPIQTVAADPAGGAPGVCRPAVRRAPRPLERRRDGLSEPGDGGR